MDGSARPRASASHNFRLMLLVASAAVWVGACRPERPAPPPLGAAHRNDATCGGCPPSAETDASVAVVSSKMLERQYDEHGLAFPWLPDASDGTYNNPVLFADYSDPDVIRVGATYYLVASSFQVTPGLPILRSPDLVNWQLVAHALENLPLDRYDEVRHGEGIWAPALREHAGTFYIFAPTPDEGIWVLEAPHPEGPWSAPRLMLEGKGLIDPCPLWDDDGKAYLVHAYARSRAGIRDRLRVRPMAPDASRVLGDGRIVYFNPDRHPTIEGPKFYKRAGWYYILAPAGGVPTGWQVALRSRSVYGPYEDRVVLEQGHTPVNGPHQGALVDTPEGSSWFVHFQDRALYGRVVHVNPVHWESDWPLMGVASPEGRREPVLEYPKTVRGRFAIEAPQTNDEFKSDALGLQWQWQANHDAHWYSLGARPGFLRLYARPTPGFDFGAMAHLLLQKLPARSFLAETAVSVSPVAQAVRAGLVLMGQEHAALVVEQTKTESVVHFVINQQIVATRSIARGPVVLRLAMRDGGLTRFSFQAAGAPEYRFEPQFQATAGRWIGAKVGVFSNANRGEAGAAVVGEVALTAAPSEYADFSYFRFDALPPR